MKRLLMSIMALSMICSTFTCSAMAVESTTTQYKTSYVNADGQQVSHITFRSIDNAELDNLTRAKQNMEALGFEQDWIDTLSEEEILDYANIDDATITTSFLKLRALTDEEQATLKYYEENNLMDQYDDPREFEVIPEAQYMNETQISTMAEGTQNRDSGYVKLTVTGVKYSAKPRNYKLSGRYEWTKMPTNRYTDYFGVSHSEGVMELADTFYAVTKHSFDQYDWLYQNSGTIRKTKNYAKSYVDKVDREISGNGAWDYEGEGGYGIKHTLHKDFTPSLSYPGTQGIQKIYYGYKGYLAYDITISNYAAPWAFNTYASLQHQVKYFNWGVSVSIPPSAGLSVEPQSSFVQASLTASSTYTP